jgi:uncharacterized protein YndB with AHSA1/START domain
MALIETEIVVARPRQEVFDYVSWGENLPQWNEGFTAVQPITGGPPTQGSQYQISMDPGGESTFEYYDFVPGYRISWHGSPIRMGPRTVAPRGRIELEDVDGGTRIRYELDPEPQGAVKMNLPMMKKKIKKDTDKDLATLKRLLEGG